MSSSVGQDVQSLLSAARCLLDRLVTYGPLFSPNYLGNILAVSNIEAGPMARLYAFWYEQNGSNDLWSVRVGLMLADSQFLQSKTASNFINNGISWPDFLAANLPASGPAYPLPAPGVRVRLKPRDDVQYRPPYSAAIPAAATAQINRPRFQTGRSSALTAAPSSSPRRATCPIRARMPAGFPAPTGSAHGITPARVSPISNSMTTASHWRTRSLTASRWSTPAMAASTA